MSTLKMRNAIFQPSDGAPDLWGHGRLPGKGSAFETQEDDRMPGVLKPCNKYLFIYLMVSRFLPHERY